MKTIQKIYIVTFFILITIIVLGSTPQHAEAAKVKVKRVINGEVIQLNNDEYVQLIGVDAPEATSNECYAKQSKRYLTRLVRNKKVRLTYDIEMKDTYGRTLAYVYQGKKFINKRMIASGKARIISVAPNTKNEATLKTAEETAKNKQRGLWVSCEGNSNTNTNTEEQPTEPISMKLVAQNFSLDRGDYAKVGLQTEAGARCTATTTYAPNSTPEGLEPQTADDTGMVLWQWKITEDVPPGEWSVTTTCSKGNKGSTLTHTLTIL